MHLSAHLTNLSASDGAQVLSAVVPILQENFPEVTGALYIPIYEFLFPETISFAISLYPNLIASDGL